ncbi:MAG: hypothetical protein HY854_24230 [Burkholderiales bacterium]|nr:hypothetical protein [Burkholderiales bacterium]
MSPGTPSPKPWRTLIAAGIVLGLAVLPGSMMQLLGSFALVGATLVFLPWAVFSLFRMARRPAERRSRAIGLGIWIATLAIAVNVRDHWDTTARTRADAAAGAVQAHKVRTGAYPNSLADVGIDAGALKEEFSMSYRTDQGKPALFYSQPSMPMVAHHYDFDTRSWRHVD